MNRNYDDIVLLQAPSHPHTDTVPHILAIPSKNGQKKGISGRWHVKYPAGVGRFERLKRRIVAGVMSLRRKPYKSRYFDNSKTLAEREVLAGKLMELASRKGPSYSSYEWAERKNAQHEILLSEGQSCVASRHMKSKYTATMERGKNIVYDGEHNPATVYVMRRLLGDEDAVKRDNYLVDVNQEGVHCFMPIDFGYAFYNHSDIADDMNFDQFSEWVLQLPKMHKLHYATVKRGESIMDLINAMSPEDKRRAVYMALTKMASISSHEPRAYSKQISDPVEKQRIYEQLQKKILTAKRLVKEARHHPDIQPLL